MLSSLLQFHPNIFKQLLRAKLTNIWSVLAEKIINIYVWAGCIIFVSGYLLQAFGLAHDFGAFQLAGIFASVGLFELYGNTAALVADIEGDRTIAYYFTLPSSIITVLLSYVCYYLIISMSMCFALLPFGKILLWNQLNLTNVSWWRLLVFVTLVNIIWATLVFVFTAYLPNIKKLGVIWCRVIFPLWFLGGYQFSWLKTHAILPMFSYVMLINPVIYCTEGIRSVLLGAEGYLPFWLCCSVLTAIYLIISVWAFKALKKRLDLV